MRMWNTLQSRCIIRFRHTPARVIIMKSVLLYSTPVDMIPPINSLADSLYAATAKGYDVLPSGEQDIYRRVGEFRENAHDWSDASTFAVREKPAAGDRASAPAGCLENR